MLFLDYVENSLIVNQVFEKNSTYQDGQCGLIALFKMHYTTLPYRRLTILKNP